MLVPPPVQHQAPVRVHKPRQLSGERCLPDPWLSGNEGQNAVTSLRARPRLPQNAEFLLAVHESAAGRGLDPHDVGGIHIVIGLACTGGDSVRRSRWPPAGRHELLTLGPGEVQSVGQQFGGGPAGSQVDTAFQVADRPRAHSRGRGQLVLGQSRFSPQAPEQFRVFDGRLLRHGRNPFADLCFPVPLQGLAHIARVRTARERCGRTRPKVIDARPLRTIGYLRTWPYFLVPALILVGKLCMCLAGLKVSMDVHHGPFGMISHQLPPPCRARAAPSPALRPLVPRRSAF